MGLSREESIRLYGTEAATGWGSAEAAANFKPVSTSSGSSGSYFSVPTFDPNSIPVSQPTIAPIKVNIEDYIQTIVDTLPEPPEQYLKANPFYFDEQSAREVATAEFSPYYDELLQDYMGDIKLTSEKNRGDAIRTLADLDKQKELFVKENGTDFEKLIRGIKEGYSNKNLFFSGENNRDQVEAQKSNANTLEGYMSTFEKNRGNTVTTDQYQQDVLKKQADQKARDLAREKTTAIYGGIDTQKNEAMDEYLYGMKLYYKNPDYKSLLNKSNSSLSNYSLSELGDTTQEQGTQY